MGRPKKPCAYCGRTDIPRTRGHVFPQSMQPSDKDPKIQWPVVPECIECKALWEGCDELFKSICVVASKAGNPAAEEQWKGKVIRSFDKDDPYGPVRFREFFSHLTMVEEGGERRLIVHPAAVEKSMLVVHRIIRGLCHKHGLGTAIAAHRVWADVLREPIEPEIIGLFEHVSLGDTFCQYFYLRSNAPESPYHSAYLLHFYERPTFIGFISASEDGFSEPA